MSGCYEEYWNLLFYKVREFDAGPWPGATHQLLSRWQPLPVCIVIGWIIDLMSACVPTGTSNHENGRSLVVVHGESGQLEVSLSALMNGNACTMINPYIRMLWINRTQILLWVNVSIYGFHNDNTWWCTGTMQVLQWVSEWWRNVTCNACNAWRVKLWSCSTRFNLT